MDVAEKCGWPLSEGLYYKWPPRSFWKNCTWVFTPKGNVREHAGFVVELVIKGSTQKNSDSSKR